MTGLHKHLPQTRHGWVAAFFLAFALLFGGGGSPSAAAEIVVQLGFAASVLAWFFWAGPAKRPHVTMFAVAALLVAVPLVQLVPLPASAWGLVPGRDLVAASLDIAGNADRWRPLTVAPAATFASLLAILPVAGLMLGVSTLRHEDRRALLLVTGLVACAGAALGVLQMAAAPGAFRLYEVSHDFWLTGFFASRNAAADNLLVGSLALSAWVAVGVRRRPVLEGDLALLLILQAFLLMALVLTGSRAGIFLLLPVLLVSFAMFRNAGILPRVSAKWASLGGLVALTVGAVIALSGNRRIESVLARFDATPDFRFELWADSWTAIGQYWPFGSGMGTFARAFLPVERAQVVDDLFPNRAHNDFLEFLIEAGVLAPLLLVTGTILVGRLVVSAWRTRPTEHAVVLYALGTFMVIALHSLVDYPLRSMALASLAGVGAGLVGAMARQPESDRRMDAQE